MIMLHYLRELAINKGDDLRGDDQNHMIPLRAESFLCLVAEGGVRESRSLRGTQNKGNLFTVDFEDRGCHVERDRE